ncbi:MAG TPA: adenylate/guanylate cyclase domain-containing protein [Solirubrobacterales bacterium]|nr:adenylate/guanylate cyclase domain-containing protein [Solirubrobacterales bacterium]
MSHPHPLTWLYRKLGPRYPAAFITVELQTAFLVAAGAVALFSFYYSVSGHDFLRVLAVTLALTAVGVGFVLMRVMRRLVPLQEWLAGARSSEESAQAWHTAVDLPIEMVRRDFWVPFVVTLVTVVASVAILELSWLSFFPILLAALLVTAYAGTLHYLALELAMRPILFDINSALDRPVRIDRPVVPLRVKLLGSLPLINVITGMVVAALTSDGGGTDALTVAVLIALFVSFTISFELTVLLTRSILRPIEDLEAATERIRQGRFDEHVPVTTSDEFGELSSAFNQMVDGLAERERLREAFGTYLDEEVASHLISEDFEPGGEELEVSLVFIDVRDFTTAASESSAAEIVARLNELFECIVPIVARHRGHIDQFIGDAVLAVFGAPQRIPRHADRAVQCAIELARTINSRRPGGFEVGVGVNSGSVVAGSIGGAGRLSFSVIGDAVNLAARVQDSTRETGDPVLITGETRAQLSETIEVEPRGEREIRGYDRRVELYAPLIPVALKTGPGSEVSDPLGDPTAGGLGRAPLPGDGLGRRARPGPGVGRAGSRQDGGLGKTHTLPGS